MGASESKLVFKQGIFKLAGQTSIPADDPYWTGVSASRAIESYRACVDSCIVLGTSRIDGRCVLSLLTRRHSANEGQCPRKPGDAHTCRDFAALYTSTSPFLPGSRHCAGEGRTQLHQNNHKIVAIPVRSGPSRELGRPVLLVGPPKEKQKGADNEDRGSVRWRHACGVTY